MRLARFQDGDAIFWINPAKVALVTSIEEVTRIFFEGDGKDSLVLRLNAWDVVKEIELAGTPHQPGEWAGGPR